MSIINFRRCDNCGAPRDTNGQLCGYCEKRFGTSSRVDYATPQLQQTPRTAAVLALPASSLQAQRKIVRTLCLVLLLIIGSAIAGTQRGNGAQQPTGGNMPAVSNPSGATPTASSLTTTPTVNPTPSLVPTLAPTIQQNQKDNQHAIDTSNHMTVGISPGFGFEVPFGQMSDSERQAVIGQMKNAGVQWLRLDYYPDASFDYQFIKDAEAAGINVDVLLEDFSATPAEFASFGTQAVTTLKPLGVHTYEILNEVNTYTPAIAAAQYVSMLKAVYTAIKAADSSARVLMSGLDFSGNADVYLQAMYDAGAKGYFDAVNAHPYSFYPNMPAPNPCPTSNAFCHGLPVLHAVMQQNGDGDKKIWITEFGCPTGTNARQPAACTDETLAQQITQAFNQASAWEWIGSFFVFSWQDNIKDGDFGLYDANGSPKSAALAAFMAISNSV